MSVNVDWPSYPSGADPSEYAAPSLPEGDTGFHVDYRVFDDVVKAMNDEYDKMTGNQAHDGNFPSGSWQEFAKYDPSYNVSGHPFILGDYPAAHGLDDTCLAAYWVMDNLYLRQYQFRWSQMAGILKTVKEKHLATEDHVKDFIAKALGDEKEAREWTDHPSAPLVSNDGAEGQYLQWSEWEGAGKSYYYRPIRQEAKAGDWDIGYHDLYTMVHALRPDGIDAKAKVYQNVAERIAESRRVLYAQATDLALGWHGATAKVALQCMQRVYELGGRMVVTAWEIGNALYWHAEKQRAWQRAVKPHDGTWEFKDNWLPWHHVGEELKKAIQQQTVETNDAFPTSVADPVFS